jgi:hypothetical protein
MQRCFSSLRRLGPALLACLLALGALSGTSEAISRKQLREEIRAFQSFLADHPRVSTELQANPNLAGNKKYLDKHDDLKKFFKQHPAVQHEVINHPRNVFVNTRRR